jgi:hypothetical protein
MKKSINSKVPDMDASPLPWLRSGRRFSHPRIVEAATMQVVSLSDFKLAPPDQPSPATTVVSSQRTETEASPASSCAATLPSESPSASPSPMPPRRSSPAAHPARRRAPPVPDWFAEAFESEGYDSEELAVLAGLIPPRS